MDPREAMLAAIARNARETGAATGRPVLCHRVLAAMRTVRRHAFVPDAADPWGDRPLSIGHGQTISQPFIVALMTDLLDLPPCARVLEIGTGSGYQAAVLAALGAEVFSIEIVPALAEQAGAALRSEGYARVHLRTGDGGRGWPEAAPFDGVMLTAAAPTIPPPLVRQLRPGGRMVLPVGPAEGEQQLVLVTKDGAGAVSRRGLVAVAFVPFTGGQDFPPAPSPS